MRIVSTWGLKTGLNSSKIHKKYVQKINYIKIIYMSNYIYIYRIIINIIVLFLIYIFKFNQKSTGNLIIGKYY